MKQHTKLDRKNQQGSRYHLKNSFYGVLRNHLPPSWNILSWKVQNTCVRSFGRHFRQYVEIEIGLPEMKHIKN